MSIAVDLAFIWAFIIAFAVFVYVVMDGFDLGLGILFPLFPKKEDRDVIMNSVAPLSRAMDRSSPTVPASIVTRTCAASAPGSAESGRSPGRRSSVTPASCRAQYSRCRSQSADAERRRCHTA